MFDILAIAPLLLLGVLFVAVPKGLPTLQLLMVGGAFLAAGLLVAIRLAWIFKTCSVWLDRSPIWRGASAVIARFLRQTASEIDKLGSKEAYLKVLFLSLLVRLSKYSSLYVLLLALLLPRGYTPASLPAPEIFLVLFSAELAATLPFAGFAAIGAYQGAWIMAFSLLGFPLHLAQVTSLAHHIFTQVYGYTLGLIALLLLSLPAFQPIQTRPAE
ncbi:MAG: hypothetical protein DCC75_13090 [Proteobacteria bacterium]|nr:MAG: hypothetical protein DCC75_13090 [Pseudomonadota bacterium]